jgi:hypothetical protein
VVVCPVDAGLAFGPSGRAHQGVMPKPGHDKLCWLSHPLSRITPDGALGRDHYKVGAATVCIGLAYRSDLCYTRKAWVPPHLLPKWVSCPPCVNYDSKLLPAAPMALEKSVHSLPLP